MLFIVHPTSSTFYQLFLSLVHLVVSLLNSIKLIEWHRYTIKFFAMYKQSFTIFWNDFKNMFAGKYTRYTPTPDEQPFWL